MKQYLLISKKFEGYLVYEYNELGILSHWQNCTWDMTEDMQVYALKELGGCLTLDKFQAWLADTGHAVVEEPVDLSFERFWVEFDKQKDRLKAETVWYKLTNKMRAYILHNVRALHRYRRRNTWYTQPYAEGYLNGGWRSDWDKMDRKAANKPAAAEPVKPEPRYKAAPRSGAGSDGAAIGDIMRKIEQATNGGNDKNTGS